MRIHGCHFSFEKSYNLKSMRMDKTLFNDENDHHYYVVLP